MKRTLSALALVTIVGLSTQAQDNLWPLLSKSDWETMSTERLDQLARDNHIDERGSRFEWTALMLAAGNNSDPKVIEHILGAGADVNARDSRGWTALMHAAGNAESHPEVIRTLISAGADVNARQENGWTPLMFATGGNGGREIIRSLLTAGARTDVHDLQGLTPLMWAARSLAGPQIVEVLTNRGGWQVSTEPVPMRIQEQLHSAGTELQVLIRRRSDIVPRLVVAIQGVGTIDRESIASVAQLHYRFAQEQTPQETVEHYQMVEHVLSRLLVLAEPYTQLRHDPEFRRLQEEMVSLEQRISTLLHRYDGIMSRFNERLSTANTVLMEPQPALQHAEVIEMLIAAGPSSNARDLHGNSVLMLVAGADANLDIVNLLIAQGAEVNVANEMGKTAVMCAARFNQSPEVIRTLAAAGAEINARDSGGWTPLMVAARYSASTDVVTALLDRGADARVLGTRNDTAWSLVQENTALRGTDIYWRLNDLRF